MKKRLQTSLFLSTIIFTGWTSIWPVRIISSWTCFWARKSSKACELELLVISFPLQQIMQYWKMESKDSLFSEGLKVFAQLTIISNILLENNSCNFTYIDHNREISIFHHSTKLGSAMSLVARIQDVQVHFQKGKIIHKNVLMEPMPSSYQAQPLQVMIFLKILLQKTKNV